MWCASACLSKMRNFVALLAACALACGASQTHIGTASPVGHSPRDPSAKERFDAALAAFAAHEKNGDWTPATCASVASAFDQSAFAIALFDAGVVLERCHDDASAVDRFDRALVLDPALHRAKTEIALVDYRKTHDRDRAITELERIVIEEKFQDAAALVAVATLQDERDKPGDADAARTNFERAMAVESGSSVTTYDALARHHWLRARKTATRPRDTMQLELAALVVSQAMQKNASYAPLFNTSGLIESELDHPHLASVAFERAAALDPTLFEAHMNLAELNLAYRGYANAEIAFRRAIALRPNDYDAHLGLALALRGKISGVATPMEIRAVRAELETCVRIDGARPDALFNDAILTQEFEVLGAKDKQGAIDILDSAISKLKRFKARAAGNATYADALKNADAHIEDAKTTRDFL